MDATINYVGLECTTMFGQGGLGESGRVALYLVE